MAMHTEINYESQLCVVRGAVHIKEYSPDIFYFSFRSVLMVSTSEDQPDTNCDSDLVYSSGCAKNNKKLCGATSICVH